MGGVMSSSDKDWSVTRGSKYAHVHKTRVARGKLLSSLTAWGLRGSIRTTDQIIPVGRGLDYHYAHLYINEEYHLVTNTEIGEWQETPCLCQIASDHNTTVWELLTDEEKSREDSMV